MEPLPDDAFWDVDVEAIERKHRDLESLVAHNPKRLNLRDFAIHPRMLEALTSPQAHLVQGSAEWHAFRLNHLNSSELGSVLGCDGFRTPDDVFRDKCLLTPPEVLAERALPKNQEALQHGHLHEPECGYLYSLRKGDLCFALGSVEYAGDPNYRFLASSVDLFSLRGQSIVEIKCPWRAVVRPMTADQVKRQKPVYAHQMQSQMLITGVPRNDFVQYGVHPNPNHPMGKPAFEITPIPFDEGWQAAHFPILRAFWDRVELHRYQHPDWDRRPRPYPIPKRERPYEESVSRVEQYWDADGIRKPAEPFVCYV